MSLTSRLSIKGSPRKNVLKMGRRTKKFEKPCPKCSVPACAYFSRQVLSQSPLVWAVGQDGQPMVHAPSFAHWLISSGASL